MLSYFFEYININTYTDDDWSGLLKKYFFHEITILGEIVTVDLTAVLKYLLLLKLASREIVNIFPYTSTSNSKWPCHPLTQAQ